MSELRFTKIKFDGTRVRLEYERDREDGGDPDEFTVFCAERPKPSFETALQALTEDVVAICELQPGDAAAITVRSVTLTYAHDILGAVVSAAKALKTAPAPLNLTTPHLPEEPYSGQPSDPNPTLPAGMGDRLRTLAREAERYVRGDRMQASLFAKAKDAPAKGSVKDRADSIAADLIDAITDPNNPELQRLVKSGEMRDVSITGRGRTVHIDGDGRITTS